MFDRPIFLCDFETTGIHAGAKPIALGWFLLDKDLNILDVQDWLINPYPEKIDEEIELGWINEEAQAFIVHKILRRILIAEGHSYKDIEGKIRVTLEDHGCAKSAMVVSDCITMEWSMLQMVLGGNHRNESWPFHYRGIDITAYSPMEPTKLPGQTPHTAIGDVGRMYARLILARERMRKALL